MKKRMEKLNNNWLKIYVKRLEKILDREEKRKTAIEKMLAEQRKSNEKMLAEQRRFNRYVEERFKRHYEIMRTWPQK